MWIARDKDGCLYIYTSKPKRGKRYFEDTDGFYRSIQPGEYPEVTWENSPKELVVLNEINVEHMVSFKNCYDKSSYRQGIKDAIEKIYGNR